MILQEYQEEWADDFTALKNILESALNGQKVSIEHIGSTSVPKLAAKPIIDIDIAYTQDEDFEALKAKLERIGYYHKGDQGMIHREVFKRKQSIEAHPVLDSIRHHLYVCPHHSQELQRHLLFRDYLRKNEGERHRYQELKYQIAEEADQDRKKYQFIKETKAKAFILSVIRKAQQVLEEKPENTDLGATK